jgi:hypothetical protein
MKQENKEFWKILVMEFIRRGLEVRQAMSEASRVVKKLEELFPENT